MERRCLYNCVEMTAIVRSLSSGTVAKLCKRNRYDDVEEYTANWVAWILSHDVRIKWETWQDCHDDYRLAMAEARQGNTDLRPAAIVKERIFGD